MRIFIFFIFHIITLSTLCPFAQADTFKDIAYNDKNNSKQMLDIYTPAIKQKNMPVVIYVHGGAWSIGDKAPKKKQSAYFSKTYNDKGIILVSINYRLSPHAQHPDHVNDVAEAVAWVHKNIEKYNGDNNNMVLMGHSAGAHLISLIGTNAEYLAPYNLTPDILRAVVPVDTAAYNLTDNAKDNLGPQLLEIRDMVFAENNVHASPYYNISYEQKSPPFIVYVSGKRSGATENSKQFVRKLNKYKHTAKLKILSGGLSHAEMNDQIFLADGQIANDVISYLNESYLEK